MHKEVKTKKLISKKKCIPDLTIQRKVPARDFVQRLGFSEEISFKFIFCLHGIELRLLALVEAVDSSLAGVTKRMIITELPVVAFFLTPEVFSFMPLTAAKAAFRSLGSPPGREVEEEVYGENVEEAAKTEVVEELLSVVERGEVLAKEF